MKKFVLLLTAGLTLTTPTLWADGDDEEIPQTPPSGPNAPIEPIPIRPPKPTPVPEPLNPRDVAPINAYYYNSTVELCFAVDLGTVIATVTNTTTGEMWCESGNSNDGVLSVEITPTPGNYSVTIETENGDIYLGMFAL